MGFLGAKIDQNRDFRIIRKKGTLIGQNVTKISKKYLNSFFEKAFVSLPREGGPKRGVNHINI